MKFLEKSEKIFENFKKSLKQICETLGINLIHFGKEEYWKVREFFKTVFKNGWKFWQKFVYFEKNFENIRKFWEISR